MKYVVIVDSMSNVPEHVLKARPNLKVIPFNTKIGEQSEVDLTATEPLRDFYRSGALKDESNIDATCPTPEQISVFILNEIAPHYDCAIFQTTSAALSRMFTTLKECSESIEKEATLLRKIAGITTPFKLMISNSGASSSGQTLLALYTDSLLNKGIDPSTCVENSEHFKSKIRTHSVISDILTSRNRMKFLGLKTIGLTTAVSGQVQRYAPIVMVSNELFKINELKIRYHDAVTALFSYAEMCIESGLHIPVVYVSYAGRMRDLHAMESFKSLQNTGKKHGVTVLSGMMSVSACINYSTSSISLGIAPQDETIDPA